MHTRDDLPYHIGTVQGDCNGHPWKRIAVYSGDTELAALPVGTKVFSADQMHAYAATTAANARAEAFEECARIADSYASCEGIAQKIAAAIRAAIGDSAGGTPSNGVCPECNGDGEFESALHCEKCHVCGGTGKAGVKEGGSDHGN